VGGGWLFGPGVRHRVWRRLISHGKNADHAEGSLRQGIDLARTVQANNRDRARRERSDDDQGKWLTVEGVELFAPF
jgi:hypothetical protein